MSFSIFFLIIAFGITLPATIVLVVNLLLKGRNGDNYNLSSQKIVVLYLVSLVGWAYVLGVFLR